MMKASIALNPAKALLNANDVKIRMPKMKTITRPAQTYTAKHERLCLLNPTRSTTPSTPAMTVSETIKMYSLLGSSVSVSKT